jgi:bidirectional [NiFe] hydrogenase diaphorase subunit
MATMEIDGRRVAFDSGDTVLAVARKNGIAIPTLCHHPGLASYGGCRLCVVDVTRPEWEGWRRLVTACEYAAEAGLVVVTNSERVVRARRTVVDLLLARCPSTPFVVELARTLGLSETSFAPRDEPDDCILCGLCVRVCAAVGADAIGSAGRGVDKQVGPPYAPPNYDRPPGLAPAADCVGCLCCAHICPTGHIRFTDDGAARTIWGRDFTVVRCAGCGAPLGTPAQLAHFAAKSGLAASYFERCDTCRKEETARAMSRVVG